MSTTQTTGTTPLRKITPAEITRAKVRLRRRLEDHLSDHRCRGAEHRFIQSMIDLLYCVQEHDSGSETIIDCVNKLTRTAGSKTFFHVLQVSGRHMELLYLCRAQANVPGCEGHTCEPRYSGTGLTKKAWHYRPQGMLDWTTT